MRVRSICSFAALLAASALFAGCSSETLEALSKVQYLGELRAAFAELKQEKNLPKQLLNADDATQRKQVVATAVANFDATVASLREIDPPEQVAGLHNQLVNVMTGFDALLNKANAAVQTDDLASLIGLPAEAADLTGQAGDLKQQFAAQGYVVEPPAQQAPVVP